MCAQRCATVIIISLPFSSLCLILICLSLIIISLPFSPVSLSFSSVFSLTLISFSVSHHQHQTHLLRIRIICWICRSRPSSVCHLGPRFSEGLGPSGSDDKLVRLVDFKPQQARVLNISSTEPGAPKPSLVQADSKPLSSHLLSLSSLIIISHHHLSSSFSFSFSSVSLSFSFSSSLILIKGEEAWLKGEEGEERKEGKEASRR